MRRVALSWIVWPLGVASVLASVLYFADLAAVVTLVDSLALPSLSPTQHRGSCTACS
jgi:hypothetical protein